MLNLDNATKIAVLKLRLLIIRAAQKDSLNWWEDESLTRSGEFLIERLFIMDAAETARSIALEAGRTRYRMAFGEAKDRLHLFRLDPNGQVDFELSDMRLTDLDVQREPITSSEELKAHLLDLTDKPRFYELVGGPDANSCLEIRIRKPLNKIALIELAETLAWACLESPADRPYFPYIEWNL